MKFLEKGAFESIEEHSTLQYVVNLFHVKRCRRGLAIPTTKVKEALSLKLPRNTTIMESSFTRSAVQPPFHNYSNQTKLSL